MKVKALFRKALLPQLDSLAGTESFDRYPQNCTLEEQHDEYVTDSLGMLGAPAAAVSRGSTKPAFRHGRDQHSSSSNAHASSSVLMGLDDKTRTKKQHAKRATTSAAGLGRYVGRTSSRPIKTNAPGDSLCSLGGLGPTATTSTRRRMNEDMEGDVLSSLENLSLRPTALGRKRNSKATLTDKLPTRVWPQKQRQQQQQHQQQQQPRQHQHQQRRFVQPSDSLATGSGGLMGFALETFSNHRSKNAVFGSHTRQIAVPRQSTQGRRLLGRPRSREPPKREMQKSQPFEQGLSAFLRAPTKAEPWSGLGDGGTLGALVVDMPHSKLKAAQVLRNFKARRTKRQDILARKQKKEEMKLPPTTGGLVATYAAQSTISEDPVQTAPETVDEPGDLFLDDDSSGDSQPAVDTIEKQPVKLTKRQQFLAHQQSEEEMKLPPTNGLGALAAHANTVKQKITVTRESSSFTQEPTKKEKKKQRGFPRSPKVSSRRSKRLATELPQSSPASSVVLKRRDEKKTPPKIDSSLKRVILGRLQSFKQSAVARNSSPRKEVKCDDSEPLEEATQGGSPAVSPQLEVDGLYSNSMSPISGVGGDDFCSDTFTDAMEIENHLPGTTSEQRSTAQDDSSFSKSVSNGPSPQAAGKPSVDTPQSSGARSMSPISEVKGDDLCGDPFPDDMEIGDDLPATASEQASNEQEDFSITKSVSKEPWTDASGNSSIDTPKSRGVRSMSPIAGAGSATPISEPGGYELFRDVFADTRDIAKVLPTILLFDDRETTRSRRSSRTRVLPDRFGVDTESTEDTGASKGSERVGKLSKARMQTKPFTETSPKENERRRSAATKEPPNSSNSQGSAADEGLPVTDTHPKKNERRRSAATKEPPNSSNSPGSATDEGLLGARRSRRARVEPNRFGVYGDTSDDKAIAAEAPALLESNDDEDLVRGQPEVGVKTSDQDNVSATSGRESQEMEDRRSNRPRVEPVRFGKYVDFSEDQENDDSFCPQTALPPALDVGTKKSALGFRVIERKMPFMKKSTPRPESISTDGWSSLEIMKLREAHGMVDSLSGAFWSDVAIHVGEKSALECRDKWFSLVQTPNPRQVKKTKNATKKNAPVAVYDEDDIFNSTPMRGELGGGAPNEGSPMMVDVGSAIKVNGTNTAAHLSSEYDGVIDPIDFQPRAGYKSYLQGMRRDVRNQKQNKSKKTQGSTQGPRCLSEAVYEGDVDMNARLTPGGTLKVKNMAEGEEDDDFWGEMYGDEDGDEVDSFQ